MTADTTNLTRLRTRMLAIAFNNANICTRSSESYIVPYENDAAALLAAAIEGVSVA